MKKVLFFIMTVIILLPAYAKDYTIGVVPKTIYTDYWKEVEEGIKAAGNDLKVKIIYRGPSYEEDAKIQIRIIEELINIKVDAVVLAPADNKELVPVVRKAIKNGIKVVIIDSALNDNSYNTYIATDNYKAGKRAGEELLKVVKDKNNIMLLKLKKGNSSTEERERGFIDAVKSGGGIVKYSEYGGMTLGASSRKAEMLISNNKVSGIFMSNGILTEGVIIAAKKMNRKDIMSIGFDSSENIKSALENGYISGVMIQNPYKMGYAGVKSAVDLLNGEEVEKKVMLDSDYIGKDRVKELK